jgi:hypothetical protein
MPPEVQALLFDTYGTVVDWRSGCQALVALGRARALDRVEPPGRLGPTDHGSRERGRSSWMTME